MPSVKVLFNNLVKSFVPVGVVKEFVVVLVSVTMPEARTSFGGQFSVLTIVLLLQHWVRM